MRARAEPGSTVTAKAAPAICASREALWPTLETIGFEDVAVRIWIGWRMFRGGGVDYSSRCCILRFS